MKTSNYFTFGNKKYEYILTPRSNTEDGQVTHFSCKDLNIGASDL